MTQASAATNDIEYVRQLAEAGAHAPLLGGRFMTWWGLLVTLAYTAQHLALNDMIGDGNRIFAWIWLSFALVATAGHFTLIRTMKAKAGAGSAGNRASRSVWKAAAFALASMAGGTMLAARSGAGLAVFDWIVPVGFAVYACALIVTGSLARSRVTLAAGAGAVVMVGVFTALILSPDRYLVAAAGAALTVFLPGLVLIRDEPRAEG